jgi:NADH-ubiquinone oxidoreductase chain 5
LLIGFGTDFWNESLYILPQNYSLSDIEFISTFYKILPLIFTLLGIFVAIYLYAFNLNFYMKIKKKKFFNFIYNFLSKKWYFDRLYNEFVSKNFLFYSYYFSYKDIDRGVLEIFGPFNLTKTLEKTNNFIKIYQSGNIFHYLFFFLVVLLLTIFTFLTIV